MESQDSGSQGRTPERISYCVNDLWHVYYSHHPQGSRGGNSLCCFKKQNISKVNLLIEVHSASTTKEKSFLGFLLLGTAREAF